MTSLIGESNGRYFEHEGYRSFEEFEACLLERASGPRNETWFPLMSSPPLYRGQGSPRWKLETTLERRIGSCSVSDYYNKIRRAHPEIASVAEKTWSVPTPARISRLFDNYVGSIGVNERLPAPEYLTYLRHHGFPSPLLDWSRSIYIAAFFAFRYKADIDEDCVSIFILDNVDPDTARATIMSPGLPELLEVGRFINTDRRHFLQQSTYTTCVSWSASQWNFASHDEFLKTDSSKNLVLIKCSLPSKQRHDVLKKLDLMNINAFSLFGTIEALMETTSNREFDY